MDHILIKRRLVDMCNTMMTNMPFKVSMKTLNEDSDSCLVESKFYSDAFESSEGEWTVYVTIFNNGVIRFEAAIVRYIQSNDHNGYALALANDLNNTIPVISFACASHDDEFDIMWARQSFISHGEDTEELVLYLREFAELLDATYVRNKDRLSVLFS